MIRLSINRTCAPQMTLPDFIALAKGAGAGAVEIRNDIEGREFADGTAPEEVKAQLDAAGLRVAAVNALQRFNEWTPAREAEALHLVRYAKALGAPGLVLCPVHNIDHGWTGGEAEANLRDGLRKLRPILLQHGVTGYVEPLGMKGSTMTRQAMAVAAIDEIGGWDAYRLCYDTFQFFRAHDDRLFPDRIGLVHVSGITRGDLVPGDLTEPDRGLVDRADRVGNLARVRAMQAAGYRGFVSMEAFNPAVQTDPGLASKLKASLARVAKALDSGAENS